MKKQSLYFSSAIFGPRVYVAGTPADAAKIEKSLGMTPGRFVDEIDWESANGKAQMLENEASGVVVIVILVPICKESIQDLPALYGTIAHECTHAKQFWFEAIGEEAPGDELEAYAVGTLFQEVYAKLVPEIARLVKGE